MAKTIKLMADYGCYPLWWTNSTQAGDIDPSSLPLSNATVERLEKWADTYDAKLNQDDPVASNFPSLEASSAFEQEGISLWKQLQTELAPNYEVVYFSYKLYQIVTNLGELKALQQ
ncbi:hypothetical protein NIES4071_22300 [Calothrix sp. NIES-4071]|nr:hypothetical protein NIES4071_22300 [Calothrix sp. NIES-4071]BAZ56562.1 hypothetical protein NIES4105_22250 [Calothrix sp. NIES-4105]